MSCQVKYKSVKVFRLMCFICNICGGLLLLLFFLSYYSNFLALMFSGHYSFEGKLPPVASGLKNFSQNSYGFKQCHFL